MLGTLFSGDTAFMATLRTRDLGRFNSYFGDHHMSGHGLQVERGDAVRFEGGWRNLGAARATPVGMVFKA